MKKIGITGQTGFVGGHLAKMVDERNDLELVPFDRVWFDKPAKMQAFVRECDIIIHLAGLTRHADQDYLYKTNVGLCQKLIDAMEAENAMPLVMFSSSIHEFREIAYGRAKLEGGRLLSEWADRHRASARRYIFPNVYGPEAKPFYCSFIANFAYQLTHNQEPQIQIDAPIRLVYVKNLCRFLLSEIYARGIERVVVPHDVELKVSEVLAIFRSFIKPDGSFVDRPADGYLRDLYDTFVSYGGMP